MRVLQIVESLDNRAVESWLLRMFSRAVIEHPEFEWTFFCTNPEPGGFDHVVREAGGYVLHSQHQLHDKIPFLTALRRVMREGKYDILHCHHDILSAAYLAASLGLPFQRRIIQCHNTSAALPTPNRIKKFLFHGPMKELCLRTSDRIVGISNDALNSIIGSRNRKANRDVVLHYGVDTEQFHESSFDRLQFRLQLGLSANAKVILFVGRMVEYKNPTFAVEVLESLRMLDPDFVTVFVGRGPFESDVRELAESKNLTDKVRVLGFRNDVPQIMKASDILIWPSQEEPREGLGLGIVEAQAAGLPILMSKSVPVEAIVVSELVRSLPLAAGAQAWANEIHQISQAKRLPSAEALTRVEASSFSMRSGLANLMALYRLSNGQH